MANENGIAQAQWYVLYTYSGYENKVAQSIMKVVEYRKLQDQVLEVKIPVETVLEITDVESAEKSRRKNPDEEVVEPANDTESDASDKKKSAKKAKEKEVTRKIFPGYVLVKMIYSDEVAYHIRSIRGVTCFVGSSPTDPTPLTEKEVAQLGVDLGKTVEVNVSVGDQVRISGTAMDGFTGVIQSINIEERTCNVLVSMFGQETPTELSLSQVIRLD